MSPSPRLEDVQGDPRLLGTTRQPRQEDNQGQPNPGILSPGTYPSMSSGPRLEDVQGDLRLGTSTRPPHLEDITIERFLRKTTSPLIKRTKSADNIANIEDNKTPGTNKKRTKTKKTTVIQTTPSSAKITNFFVKKAVGEDLVNVKTTLDKKMTPELGDNNVDNSVHRMSKNDEHSMNNSMINNDMNEVKTTFSSNRYNKSSLAGPEKSLKKNVCVFVGGKCNVHNKKLTRSFKLKKMSVVGKDGKITWVTREVTVLVCPVVAPSRVNSVEKAVEYPGEVGTNKKRRILLENCANQPASQDPLGES